ncbi:MAG: hypothetical protein HFH37_04375 [Lachnospiraceae bacterium]|nr:hypothetical protein [Lachnospiraceae bacterium]
MKLKKVVSNLLACAMVVTTVFTGNVTAASAAQAKIIQPLAKYDFNATVSEDNGKYQDIQMITNQMVSSDIGKYSGKLDFMPGRGETGNALSTDGVLDETHTQKGEGKYGLKLPQTNLGNAYTVSAWFKSSWGTLNSKADKVFAVMSIGKSAEENVTIKPIAGSNGRDLYLHSGSTQGSDKMSGSGSYWMEWHMFTITQSGNQVICYLDGNKVSEAAVEPLLNDNSGSIYLGVNQGGGGYATGEYDDISVYNVALDADQVSDLHTKGYAEVGRTPEEILQDVTEIDVTKNLSLNRGAKGKIKVTLPGKLTADKCDISFAVKDNSDVISVDESTGEVTANREGTAEVVTSVKAGNTTKTGTTSVVVTESFKGDRDPIAKITASCYDRNVTLEPTKSKTVFRLPSTLKLNEDVSVTYASSNEGIAKVSASGVVTAQKKVGYARITTTVKALYDGFEMEYQTLVKVNHDITKVKASANATSLAKGKKATITITPTAAMKNAGYTMTAAASGAMGSASVKGNTVTVTAKKSGTGTVAVKIKSAGKSITKRISFNVGEITGVSSKSVLKVKKSVTLKVKGLSGKVTWSLDKKSKKLAKITKTGKLTAKKKGTAKVTAKVKVGKKTVTLTISVKIKK